ncbi:MAG: ArsO family NAD(P)H-dependent flavin-containing monooxygenase [Cytophagales bacterium]|nr:ArsO family NAD(P)H-dependent flavin-containing monooxygenase [Cytophagales bacterium]
MKVYDNIIIGGGQAALSVAYFFRRYKLDYLILDNQVAAGGSWLQTWDSLSLFSPTTFSSLSGWMMPKGEHDYPTKEDFIAYLRAYEDRYKMPIQRPVQVQHVNKKDQLFEVHTNVGSYSCKTLVSATGSSNNPHIPKYAGYELFEGQQLHSYDYRNSKELPGKKTLIIGGGNSGAQILAEVSKVADTQWVTLEAPKFLPDDVDGRVLFHEATNKFFNKSSEKPVNYSLGDIVMVPSVKEARQRDVLHARRPFKSFFEKGVIWEDGTKELFDTVIWCTGFKPDFVHLQSLDVVENGRIPTQFTRSKKEPNLWLVGYGSWTGFASATIYGVGKTAKQTAMKINEALQEG